MDSHPRLIPLVASAAHVSPGYLAVWLNAASPEQSQLAQHPCFGSNFGKPALVRAKPDLTSNIASVCTTYHCIHVVKAAFR